MSGVGKALYASACACTCSNKLHDGGTSRNGDQGLGVGARPVCASACRSWAAAMASCKAIAVGFGTAEAGGCRVRAPDGRGRLRLGSQAASCWQGHGVQRGSEVRHGNGEPWSWLLTRAYVVHMYRCRGDARMCVCVTTGNQVAAQRLGKHGCGARATNVWSWVVERTKLGHDRSRASKANMPSFVAE